MTTLSARQIKSLESLSYVTPPVCSGQIVEVSYGGAADGEGGGWIVQRIHDRSDRTTTHYARSWEDGEEFEPQNGEPGGEFLEVEDGDQIFRHIG